MAFHCIKVLTHREELGVLVGSCVSCVDKLMMCWLDSAHRRCGRVHPLHRGHENTDYEPGINPPPPANLYSRPRDVNPSAARHNEGFVYPQSPPPHYDFYYSR